MAEAADRDRTRRAANRRRFACALPLPRGLRARLNTRLGHWAGLTALVALGAGAVFGGVHLIAGLRPGAPAAAIGLALWSAYGALMIVAGFGCWLVVRAGATRRIAEAESRCQTNLLMREIRAHRRTDAALQKAKETAEAANQAKSRYMAGLSHELRSPLNTILGYAQILEDDDRPAHRRADSVRMIRRSAEHLAGLIEGLLDISKIEAGRLNIYRNEFCFDEFLDQLVDMFRIQAEAKGLEFRFDRPDVLPEVVHSDENRVRQILINLLSNAVKYTDAGHVSFRVRYHGQVAEFTVEDTGVGIREDDFETIFEPFVRIQELGTRAKSGTGLGLTITKLLAEVLGGEVTVESVPGEGSTFRVRLMIAAVHQPLPPRAVRRIHGYHGRRLIVAVADDDPAHRELISDILMPLGFIVMTAADGPGCLDIAARSEPDIFLLDISMPGMSGWEVAERLRRDGFEKTPMIMVSAVAGGEIGGNPGPEYHDARVTKPIRISELLDRMGKLLKIEWIRDPAADEPGLSLEDLLRAARHMRLADIQEMRELSRIGHARALQIVLEEIEARQPELEPVTGELKSILGRFDFDRLEAVLERVQHEVAG
jgi:signal transduction histidine kinase/CheY-like chemotaxis protein